MRLGRAGQDIVRWDDRTSTWTTDVSGAPADVVALLQRGGRPSQPVGDATGAAASAPHGLPFQPASLRGVMVSELHYVRGARTMVRHFMPAPVAGLIRGYETLTRRTFPALKPPPHFYQEPAFYFGHALGVVPDGSAVAFPAGCAYPDFELELGAIVTHSWDSATQGPPTAADVIGAFTVINDFSARDVQWVDERRGAFSGVIKAKSFATGMGATVVTADEILSRVHAVTGRVRVNGDVWCEGSTAGGQFSLDEIVAHIAAGEQLYPGEVISLGTLPGCCGLELDQFLTPGDEVRLELDGVGTLTNTVASA